MTGCGFVVILILLILPPSSFQFLEYFRIQSRLVKGCLPRKVLRLYHTLLYRTKMIHHPFALLVERYSLLHYLHRKSGMMSFVISLLIFHALLSVVMFGLHCFNTRFRQLAIPNPAASLCRIPPICYVANRRIAMPHANLVLCRISFLSDSKLRTVTFDTLNARTMHRI